MIATIYLTPCPLCPKGKNCKGHVLASPVSDVIEGIARTFAPEKPCAPEEEALR